MFLYFQNTYFNTVRADLYTKVLERTEYALELNVVTILAFMLFEYYQLT